MRRKGAQYARTRSRRRGISARAEKGWLPAAGRSRSTSHPRSRGECEAKRLIARAHVGTSPLMRRKAGLLRIVGVAERVIPTSHADKKRGERSSVKYGGSGAVRIISAQAENLRPVVTPCTSITGHPRRRGESQSSMATPLPMLGSSPHVRRIDLVTYLVLKSEASSRFIA